MRCVVSILVVLLFGATARGQEDARQKIWQQAMTDLSAVLAGDDSAAVVQAVEGSKLRAFGSTSRGRLVDLFDLCTGTVPITTRGYLGAPKQAATDVAADFAASDLPQAVKQRFAAPDAARAREADETAGQWITDALAADEESFIGLLVFWRGNQSLPSLADSHTRHVIFVLVAGEVTEDNTARIRQIVFGNPLQSAN
jgi:hypothetical protein